MQKNVELTTVIHSHKDLCGAVGGEDVTACIIQQVTSVSKGVSQGKSRI